VTPLWRFVIMEPFTSFYRAACNADAV